MTRDEKLQHCAGCGDDFYNRPKEGTYCWSLPNAELVTRYAIGFWTPMTTARNLREVQVFNCYHERGNQRTVYMHAVPDHLKAEWEELKREARIRAAQGVQTTATEGGIDGGGV